MDTDSVVNERWLVMASLKMVLGARPRFRARSPGVPCWPASTRPAVVSARAAVGSNSASLRYCWAVLVTAACSSSVTPNWYAVAWRARWGGRTRRISALVSYSTLASSVPALPSTPLWWALV